MRRLPLLFFLFCITLAAHAQPVGPGPVPSPWNYGPGLSLGYDAGGITLNNPTGGTLGPGWLNVAGGLAVNGSPIVGSIGSQPANLFYATPNGSPGSPILRPIASGDLPPSLAVAGTFSVIGQTTLGPLVVNGAVSGVGLSNYLASPPPIGGTTPNTAKFITPAISDRSTFAATTAYVMAQLSLVNVLDYGADPSGTTDSCATAVPNALNAIPSTGGTLYFPHGTYLCSTKISISNKPIAILGDGPGISVINFSSGTTGSAGISISQNSPAFPTMVSGLSIITNVAQAANDGILINYTVPPNVDRTSTISYVDINGGITNTNYWHRGINCINCGYGVLDNFHIKGKNEGNPPGGISASNMLAGIALSAKSSDLRITKGSVIFANYGAYISGDSESQQFDDTTMLAVNYGWFADDFAGSADATAILQAPGPRVYNSHCAAYFGCVVTKGWAQTILTGNLFYKRPESTSTWNAVSLLNGTYQGPTTVGTIESSITGNNKFVGFLAGGSTAIGVNFDTLANGNDVKANSVGGGLTNFANFNNSSLVNVISNNSSISGGITGSWFLNPSPATIAFDNLPINAGTDTGIIIFPANAATPNVGGFVVSTFLTANSSPISITNLLNGYVGQTITIVANDANTTVLNNANIILHSGASYVMSLGNTLTLKREQNTYWREIGRS
jgi:hypothetical protein